MVEARSIRLTALLLSAMVATANAQTLPAPAGEAPPSAAPTSNPDPAPRADPSVGVTGSLAPSAAPAPNAMDPYAAPPLVPTLDPYALPMRSGLPPLDPRVPQRFRAGRAVYNVGTAVSFVGSGLTLASVIVAGVYGLGLAPSDDQVTGRIGPGLAYAGSSATGAGFILVTTGLGLQHSALALAGQDPGRGLYGAGTALGILGLCSLGTSYFFGLSHYGGEDSGVVAFGAAIAAGTLLSIGSVLFWSDAARLRSVYRRLTTF